MALPSFLIAWYNRCVGLIFHNCKLGGDVCENCINKSTTAA